MHEIITDQAGTGGGARRRRPFLASLTTLGVVAGLLGVAGVFANGSDRAVTGDNEVDSGALERPEADLQLATGTFTLSDDQSLTVVCNDDWSDDLATGILAGTVDDGQTGDHFEIAPLCIRNVGAAPVDVQWSTFEVIDLELACSEGEEAPDCGEVGELSQHLALDPATAPAGTGRCTTAPAATVSDLQSPADLLSLAPNEVRELCVHALWDFDPASQTDQVLFRLAFDAATGTQAPPACVEDPAEENDDTASATPYAGPTSGQACAADSDYYAYQHTGGDLVVEAAHDPTVGDIDLRVLDASGAQVGSGGSTRPVERVVIAGPAGAYFVEVYGYNGAEAPYELSITSLVCEDDTAEDNDTPATAAAFDGSFDGVACNGDQDFFVYEHPGGDFHAFLDFDAPAVDLDLALINADGTVIANAQGTQTDETIDRAELPAGTYQLRVREFIANGGASYSLTAGPVVTAPPAGEAMP